MNRTSKIIILVFSLIFAALILGIISKSLYSELSLSQDCWAEKKAKKIEANGVIENKFIDSHNHNFKAISVVSKDEKFVIHFPSHEYSALWRKIKINDIIIKEKNSLTYYLSREGKTDTVIVRFNCKK